MYGGVISLAILIAAITFQHHKGVVTFIFDDGIVKDAKIVEIFDKYNLKCGFALISSLSEEEYKRYLGYQNNGYEILSHSIDPGFSNLYDEVFINV